MQWSKPSVREYCVGMEVTSYESADIGPVDPLAEVDSPKEIAPEREYDPLK